MKKTSREMHCPFYLEGGYCQGELITTKNYYPIYGKCVGWKKCPRKI